MRKAEVIFAGALILLFGFLPLSGEAQALTVKHLESGTQLVLITRPLAELDAACWPDKDAAEGLRCLVTPELLFSSALEAEMAGLPAPKLLLILSGAAQRGVLEQMERVFKEQAPLSPQPDRQTTFSMTEGSEQRRLSAPGTTPLLRLEIPLPEASERRRSALEVFWHLLPAILDRQFPGIRGWIEGPVALLEVKCDSPELCLSALRLALARLSADPALKAESIDQEARRQELARIAGLEDPEEAGREIVERWRSGGIEGIREYLFGLKSVDLPVLNRALQSWLAVHPGRAIISLPPRIFQPRFAPGPRRESLENDLSIAVLERPQTGLSALVLRPILLSGIGGDEEAVVLTRLGGAIRTSGLPVPSVAVHSDPPRLELIGGGDDFALLCEALQSALRELSEDQNPLSGSLEIRDRALALLGAVIGLNSGGELSTADILAPGNLALGAVAPDAETAVEALKKFGVGGEKRGDALLSTSLDNAIRRREAAAGSHSAVAAAIRVPSQWPLPQFLASLLELREKEMLQEASTEVLHPLVPGESLLILIVEADEPGIQLEDALRDKLEALLAPVDEEMMAGLRRRVILAATRASSGVIGRARLCAAIAAGEAQWRVPTQQEMQIMGFGVDEINEALEEIRARKGDTEWATVGPMALEEAAGSPGVSTDSIDQR